MSMSQFESKRNMTEEQMRESESSRGGRDVHLPTSESTRMESQTGGRQQRMGGRQETGPTDPTIQYFNRLVAKDTHCLLARTGIKVSRVCLGTMNFGEIDKSFGERPGQLREDEAHKILDKFVELGGNCIDTADFFPWFGSTSGQSESILGNWLQRHNRENIFLMTKIRMPTDPTNVNSMGLSRSNIINSVEKCLKRLKTSYIDMLQLNGWDPTVSVSETVRNLDELVRSGRVRYIGVCDFKAWQLQKFIDTAKMLNMHNIVCYEGEYNLLTRGCENEVVDVCRNERVGFFAYSPLKYGILTNNYNPNSSQPVHGSRIEAATKGHNNLVAMARSFEEIRQHPIYKSVLTSCEKIGKKHNLSTAQVSILWALQKGFVTSVVLGVSNVKELEECMSVLTQDKILSYDDLCELNEASTVELHYPYHAQLSQIAGYRHIPPTTQFEQLSLLSHSSSFENGEQRLRPSETWHESKSPYLPEQYHQQKFKQPSPHSQQQHQQQLQQMQQQQSQPLRQK